MDERCAIEARLWPYHETHVTRPPLEVATPGSGLPRSSSEPLGHPTRDAVLTSPSTLGDAWRVC